MNINITEDNVKTIQELKKGIAYKSIYIKVQNDVNMLTKKEKILSLALKVFTRETGGVMFYALLLGIIYIPLKFYLSLYFATVGIFDISNIKTFLNVLCIVGVIFLSAKDPINIYKKLIKIFKIVERVSFALGKCRIELKTAYENIEKFKDNALYLDSFLPPEFCEVDDAAYLIHLLQYGMAKDLPDALKQGIANKKERIKEHRENKDRAISNSIGIFATLSFIVLKVFEIGLRKK